MKHKKAIIILLMFSLAIPVLAVTTSTTLLDPIIKAKNITACLLKLADDIGPYIGFAFALMGGLTYVSSFDSNQQRMMGKKFVIFGVIGIILIKVLVAIAAGAPFNITVGMCLTTPAGGPPVGPAAPSAHLTSPPTPTTLMPAHPL
jgi:hypothetical protein